MFLRSLLLNKGLTNVIAIRLISPACYSTDVAPVKPAEKTGFDLSDPKAVADYKETLQQMLKKELPKPYDGPERDLVNFPRLPRRDESGKVRMGFIPDEWFQFFYKKTGVTGPYLFGTGLVTFLISKELYVIEDEFSTGLTLFLLTYFAVKKFGPATKAYLEKCFDDEILKHEKTKTGYMQEVEDSIAEAKKQLWQAEGQKMLIAAKRENVQMQLETEYRRRMMNVYEEVKKRLDYQLDHYNTRRKLEQKHMVDWIVNNVIKSITPQQEKEALQKCIEDLKMLSAKA